MSARFFCATPALAGIGSCIPSRTVCPSAFSQGKVKSTVFRKSDISRCRSMHQRVYQTQYLLLIKPASSKRRDASMVRPHSSGMESVIHIPPNHKTTSRFRSAMAAGVLTVFIVRSIFCMGPVVPGCVVTQYLSQIRELCSSVHVYGSISTVHRCDRVGPPSLQ